MPASIQAVCVHCVETDTVRDKTFVLNMDDCLVGVLIWRENGGVRVVF